MTGIIDTNVYLSRWPFRRLAGDETEMLVASLRRRGISQAWVGSFDAILHRDVAGLNARLAAECRQHGPGFLIPFGTVNPTLPDWEEDLRRCAVEHGMPGVRLHPNYHGYALDAPVFQRLLELATERNLIVQLSISMEDQRTQHPLVRVADVDTTPLTAIVKQLPALNLQLLGALRSVRISQMSDLAEAGNVYCELSMLEGVGGVERLLAEVPLDRVLFGSHFPLLYVESAVLKLQESALAEVQRRAITAENARRLLLQSGEQQSDGKSNQ